jgi:hypothetical protein
MRLRVREDRLKDRARPAKGPGDNVRDVQESAASIPAPAPSADPSQPLPEQLRTSFETGFGHDFSKVRIHADEAAAESAAALDARAYTVGHDVVFGATQYAPDTPAGQTLLAHELSHVVQQTSTSAEHATQGHERDQSDAAPYEREADHAAARVMAGHTGVLPSPLAAGPQVQRFGASLVLAGGGPTVGLVPALTDTVDSLWTDLHAFVDRGNAELSRVDLNVRDYIERYDGAYESVVRLLSEAKKKEAEREKWKTALEVVAAVGIGLAGGALFEEAELMGEVVHELIKKGAEIGAVEVLSPPESKVDFGLPPELGNDRVARGYLDELAKAWKGMAITAQAVLQFDTRVHNAEHTPAAGKHDHPSEHDHPSQSSPGAHPAAPAEPFKPEDLGRLRRAMTGAEHALSVFLTTVDTPVLNRSQQQIERDLWIRWMSQSEENAATVGSDEDIAEHAEQIHLYRDMVGGTGAYDEAKLQVERLNQLGRVGVVALPPYWPHDRSHPLPGAIHVRADAYEAAGRQEPPQTGAPPYVALEWQEDTKGGRELRTGDVVILEDTASDAPPMPYSHQDTYRHGGLLPKRLGPFLGVDPSERAAALSFVGENAASYPRLGSTVVGEGQYDYSRSPDRALPFIYDVRQAVEKLHADPPLVVSQSEEGVLVSEADGTALLLFTIYTSFQEAKDTMGRMGVPRVIAVALNASSGFEDFADQNVIVTRRANYEQEISAMRALLGRGPIITVKDSRQPSR